MHIITTTINEPTKATLKFCELSKKNNWNFTIIGDRKTPHSLYESLVEKYSGNVEYLDTKKQDELYPELSSILGWNTIQRRNIGFLHAYKSGAEVIATVDDDNIPYDNWGENILIGKDVEVDVYKNKHCPFFDPFSVTNQKEFWHRGFPLDYLDIKNHVDLVGTKKIKVLIQADFWDGDPDIDAICRLTKKPLVKFDRFQPFTTFDYAPFNTQNTFLHRSIFPHFSVWPSVGRMDDIWASYYIRNRYPSNIVYCQASVYQERNPQDLVKNLENECIGYRYTREFVENGCDINLKFVPEETKKFIELYQNLF